MGDQTGNETGQNETGEPDAAVSWSAWTSRHPGDFQPRHAGAALDAPQTRLVADFSDLYYGLLDEGRGVHTVVLSWLGYEMFKCPLDLWIYQEIIARQRPDIIVEIGTYKGGCALYLASICDLIGHGRVLSVDIDATHAPARPRHPRIRYLHGDSLDPAILAAVEAACSGAGALVILDGDHRCAQVLGELRAYARFVPGGGYLIVEDTNVNGHPSLPDFGPGPWEAVEAFLAETDAFAPDRACERFLLTMNPRGYLRRSPGPAA